jgi:hypothetical protein
MLSNTEIQGGTLPLTNEESAMLKLIYRTRLKVFILVYIFLLFVAVRAGMSIDGHDRYGNQYEYDPKDTGLTRMQMYAVTIPLMELFVFTTGIIFFRKRIWTIRKDFQNNIKEVVYYTVTQKESFENTGQYFIGLNHPDFLFQEVSFDVWDKINVGENFGVYRAPISKYVFNPKGKFTIM